MTGLAWLVCLLYVRGFHLVWQAERESMIPRAWVVR